MNKKTISFLLSTHHLNVAYNNRLQYRAQGLVANGYNVLIISLFPIQLINKYGIPVITVCNQRRNIFSFIVSLLKSIKTLQSIDYLSIDSTNVFLLMWYIFFKRFFHYKLLHEQTEWPFLNKTGNKLTLWMYKQLCRRLYGIVVISETLALFYKTLGIQEDRIYKLPMLIDPSPFLDINPVTVDEEYIAYCGEMNNNKDGIDDLIEAFAIFSCKVPNIKLYLIGDTSDKSQYELYVSKVLEKKLEDRVVFTGRVPHKNMPGYLFNAKILVLARPDNKQAQNGFPSKLGEYLATGKPVVITRTGEIDKYLIDGSDCFFVEPDNSLAFADKLYDVVCDYEKALEVGSAGKQKVFREFNYVVQMRKLIDFLDK